LFGILFFWQIPHFLAVSWIYRRDYARVRFPILPVRDASGGKVAGWALVNTILLLAVSLLPVALRMLSPIYGIVAALAGGWMLLRAVAFCRAADRDAAARRLFLSSLAYLPVTLGSLVVDRIAHL